MDLIDRFIERYRREFDFFDQAARLAHGQLDSALASSGIQAMVTYRAKRPDRLEQKLRQRDQSKNYANTQDIYDDIVDFAGVRVALYFPGAREEVDKSFRPTSTSMASRKNFRRSHPHRLTKNDFLAIGRLIIESGFETAIFRNHRSAIPMQR